MKRTALILTVIIFASGNIFAQDADCPKRLRQHVEYLASDALAGRKAGSDGELSAAQYVYDRMEEAGVIMLSDRSGQDFTIAPEKGEILKSRNVVGIVEGYDPDLKNEFIVVGANIDHIGTNSVIRDGREERHIMPGADNNASGTACLIELAQRVAASSFAFRRSVVFIGFGAGREGFAGAWYFANRSFDSVDDISMMLNLNMVGRQGSDSPLMYCTGVPNPELTYLVGEVCRDLMIPPLPQMTGELPSADYLAFYEKGLPVMLLTTGVHPEWYSARDRASTLNYDYMETVCEVSYDILLKAGQMDKKVSRTYTAPKEEDAEKESASDKIWSPYEVDRAPQFYHSDERMFLQKWVYVYLRYPEDALAMGIQGQVIVEFIVEKDGSVTNVSVAKASDPDLADEAVKVVSASPKWKPALVGKEKVRVKMSVPIEFKLNKR